MTKRWIKKSTTHDLVRADYDPQTRRAGLVFAWILILILLASIGLGAAYVIRYSTTAQTNRQLSTLQEENKRLQEALIQSTAKIQQDEAAREELERQLSESSANIQKMRDELTFYHQQTRR
ncbi:MAG: hypothetical protein LBV61_10095 [Burkholderiaceae bacterium]|jgi:septal ring factor EnvC (AmiA/AmiB activator)|nr:hypothetical protein [Burkholderiaceae bacterium]